MKNWLGVVVALCIVLFGGVSAGSAARMEVKGVIANWKEVKARIPPRAYLQLVKIEENLKGTSDAQGLGAFDSEYPKVTVLADGSFQVDMKGLPEGKFFIALQRAVPREAGAFTLVSGTPILVTKDGNPLIIEVPGSFPKDVGQVVVAVKTQKGPAESKK
ncbi:MAG: hypothetical protein ACUVXF_10720 [Desulfobaccales bacterium]